MKDFIIFLLLSVQIFRVATKSLPITRFTSDQFQNIDIIPRLYIEVPITNKLLYYTPLPLDKIETKNELPSYLAFADKIGKETILLREYPIDNSNDERSAKFLRFHRETMRHRQGIDLREPGYFVYKAVTISLGGLKNFGDEVAVPCTRINDKLHDRMKRSKVYERLKDAFIKRDRAKQEKRVIHIPTLFIDPEMDGFQNIFYEEMVTTALCLTSQPGLNRHELVDELEVLLCNRKGYGNVLNLPKVLKRSKRQEAAVGDEVRQETDDSEGTNWHMNKTHYDTLWKGNHNGSTTPHPLGEEYNSGSVDYDYDSGDTGRANVTGWEDDDMVEDPSGLNYMTWPPFLPEGVKDDDDLRRTFHTHTENFTLDYIRVNLVLGQAEVPFEKRLFALNDSSYLANYYEYTFKLTPYSIKPLLVNFLDNRQATLNSFQNAKLNSTSLRQLLFLFILDVHHVNCFNRHLRFYGYMMKKPAGINGDTITNGARLTRGIIMRSLELIRHVPQYNYHRVLLLRFLIAALKERASFSKNLTTIIGENDYIELYEVASYLEYLLTNGIHPDEINQDLFVQETRFYSHHFMNTLTL